MDFIGISDCEFFKQHKYEFVVAGLPPVVTGMTEKCGIAILSWVCGAIIMHNSAPEGYQHLGLVGSINKNQRCRHADLRYDDLIIRTYYLGGFSGYGSLLLISLSWRWLLGFIEGIHELGNEPLGVEQQKKHQDRADYQLGIMPMPMRPDGLNLLLKTPFFGFGLEWAHSTLVGARVKIYLRVMAMVFYVGFNCLCQRVMLLSTMSLMIFGIST